MDHGLYVSSRQSQNKSFLFTNRLSWVFIIVTENSETGKEDGILMKGKHFYEETSSGQKSKYYLNMLLN